MTNSALSGLQIDLWLLDIRKATPELFSAAEAMMSDHEQARAQKFLRGKQEFIASRWLIRRLLAYYTNIPPKDLEFEYTPKGKPALANSSISFSLSHSGHWALLAVGTQKWLGVDIESRRTARDLHGIAQSFFHPNEFQRLNVLPEENQADYFYKLWTLKEAFFKALGSGISAGLEKACFTFSEENIDVDIAPDLDTGGASTLPSEWQFYHTTHEHGAQAAVAYQAPQPVAIKWFNPLTSSLD